jgi:hypothetical protein
MKLSEVFSQLAYGELSQLNLVDQATGEIAVGKYTQLVSHINLGLTALYKRFPLKESRVIVTLQPQRVTYPLSTQDSVGLGVEAGTESFEDDILKIERVYASGGKELSLNDSSDKYSCFTSSASTLRVPIDIAAKTPGIPEELVTDTLLVVYRANHPILVKGSGFKPGNVELELPYTHLEPLLYYVASRINNPIGMTNEFHAGNSYAAKYERSCQELESVNLRVDQGSQNTKLRQKGFV